MDREQRITALMELLEQRIVLLDGAMGTMIQRYGLTEEDYRGERFSDWKRDLKGNNDLLTLTRPAVIREIHQSFLESGADIIETNTFNANAPSMAAFVSNVTHSRPNSKCSYSRELAMPAIPSISTAISTFIVCYSLNHLVYLGIPAVPSPGRY